MKWMVNVSFGCFSSSIQTRFYALYLC